MRLALALVAVGALTESIDAQSLSLKPNTLQQVTVEGHISGPLTPGSKATLFIDVTPKPGHRVYAAGAKDFSPVTVVMTPNAAIVPAKAVYPPSVLDGNSGAPVPVPVYRETFRILQPITVQRAVRAGQVLTLAAAINYQACDDRLCYPAASIPVVWSVTVQ